MNARIAIAFVVLALTLTGGAYALVAGPFTADGLGAALRDPAFHKEMGYRLAAEGDWDGAQHAFSRAVAIEPNRESTRRNLAIASFNAGDHADAITQYRALLSIDGSNREYRFDLAQSLVAHARTDETDVQAAIAQLIEAKSLLESVGDYPHAHENAQIIAQVLADANV